MRALLFKFSIRVSLYSRCRGLSVAPRYRFPYVHGMLQTLLFDSRSWVCDLVFVSMLRSNT